VDEALCFGWMRLARSLNPMILLPHLRRSRQRR
jgi:hypothetical protein